MVSGDGSWQNGALTATTLTETLDAGTYYIFVHGTMFSRGTFTLDIRENDPLYQPIPIAGWGEGDDEPQFLPRCCGHSFLRPAQCLAQE